MIEIIRICNLNFVFLLFAIFVSCNNQKIEYYKDGSIKSIERAGEYIEYNKNGQVIRNGVWQDQSFYGIKYDYSEEGNILREHIIKDDSVFGYNDVLNNNVRNSWIVKSTKEQFFLDVNKDTFFLGDLFKAKFIVNHRIGDSIRIFRYDTDTTLIFRWPEDRKTSFIYDMQLQKLGKQMFSGKVSIRYNKSVKSDYANKLIEIPFNVPYFVEHN